MTDGERVLYRWFVGVAILASVVAAIATYLASCNDAAWEGLTAIVDGAPVIPARYWAQGSEFPDHTAIYFFWACPVFPASLVAFAARLWSPSDTVGAWRSANFELKYRLGRLVILAVGLSMLWTLDGVEAFGMPIGTRLADLLFLGWINLAIGDWRLRSRPWCHWLSTDSWANYINAVAESESAIRLSSESFPI
jgi:hypothetical protein